LFVAASAAFVGGLAAKPWVRQGLEGAALAGPAPAPLVQGDSPTNAFPPAVPSADRRMAFKASLWIDGQLRAHTGERLALASGAAFRLKLEGQRSGWVQVMATNPDGVTQALWRIHVAEGDTAWTPVMRLQGVRGMETLRVVSEPHSRAVFRILHV